MCVCVRVCVYVCVCVCVSAVRVELNLNEKYKKNTMRLCTQLKHGVMLRHMRYELAGSGDCLVSYIFISVMDKLRSDRVVPP